MARDELLKASKPILFNTEMVRAILDGRKTCTRRLVKFLNNRNPNWSGYVKDGLILYNGNNQPCNKPSPYKYGDILYVRETWFYESHMEDVTAGEPDLPSGCYSTRYVYKASNPDYPVDVGVGANGWRPSIHMPKEAARIFLRVTGVRVERLQDCGNAQAKDEGFNCGSQFARLWDTTIKKSDLDCYGWAANPWVWVIEFERVEVQE